MLYELGYFGLVVVLLISLIVMALSKHLGIVRRKLSSLRYTVFKIQVCIAAKKIISLI